MEYYNAHNSIFYLDDCNKILPEFEDNYFDIAIVDPPYGIGQNWRKDKMSKFYNHSNSFNNSIPDLEYFHELFRVSKNQIIWGCNYFWNFLPPSNNLIFWDKKKDAKSQKGSAGELAWTSFSKYPLLKYEFMWNGCCTCEKVDRIHPHQKPVSLYLQCLRDFAKPGDKILDTHAGSCSLAVACGKLGYPYLGIEKDKTYLEKGVLRFRLEMSKTELFDHNSYK